METIENNKEYEDGVLFLNFLEKFAIFEKLIPTLLRFERLDLNKIFANIWESLMPIIKNLYSGAFITITENEISYVTKTENDEIFLDERKLTEDKKKRIITLFKEIKQNKKYSYKNYEKSDIEICELDSENIAYFVAYLGQLIGDIELYLILFKVSKKSPFLEHEIQAIKIVNNFLSTLIVIHFQINNKNIIDRIYFSSAHSFQKIYNTPVRNLCYILRQYINPYNDRARVITYAIQDFIDLWGNEFSAKTYMGQLNIEKNWIEGFYLNDFKEDLRNFAHHFFVFHINNLYDHYEILPNDSGRIEDVWDGTITWKKFFNLTFEFSNQEIFIFGIRPFFRAILINFLHNAIESLDLYEAAKFGKNEQIPEIRIEAFQTDNSTEITFKSQGKLMKKELVDEFNYIFLKAFNGKLHRYAKEWIHALQDKKYTTKPGTGSGLALIEAAHYFSRVVSVRNNEIISRSKLNTDVDYKENYTIFNIKFPFGYELAKNYLKDPYQFQSRERKINFIWNLD